MKVATARDEWRAHWRVVVGAFFGMALGYSAWTYTQSIFIQPLQTAFGWSRSEIALAFNLNIFAALVAPMIGRLVDRVGVRAVLLTCLAIIGVVHLSLAQLSGSYAMFLILYLLLALAGIGTTGLVYTRAVASWFEASRGTALAMSRVGMSVFAAFLPVPIFLAIANYGFAAGYYILAACALLIALPISAAWVRDQRPDSGPLASRTPAEPIPWLTLLRDRRVIYLCIAAGCTYAPTIAILSQLQPLLTGAGIEPLVAARFGALMAASIVIGTVLTGVLVDRIWAPLIGCTFTVLPALGVLLLLPDAPGLVAVTVAVTLVGLAQGAEIDVVAYMIGRYFGMKAYSAIFGLTVVTMSMLTAVGAMLFAWSFDVLGTYDYALIGASVTFAIGAAAYLRMGPYP